VEGDEGGLGDRAEQDEDDGHLDHRPAGGRREQCAEGVGTRGTL
jgi:hypothetical protein